MPEIELDLDAVVPQEGYYRAIIKKAELAEAKSGDSYNIVLDLQLTETQDDDDEGFQFRVWLSTKKQAMFNVRNFIAAAFQGNVGGKITLTDEFLQGLEGRVVLILATHGEYQGNVTFNVRSWLSDVEEVRAEIDPSDRLFM